MSDGRKVDLVVFDLGGVVVQIARSWEEGCAGAGIDVRDPAKFGEPALQAKRAWLTKEHQSGRMSCDAYYEAIAGATAGLYGADEIAAIHKRWVRSPYEGVAELVREIHAHGAETACLSNTNHTHWVDMLGQEAHGGGSHGCDALLAMRGHLTSHELGAYKPDAEIYELAEAAIRAQFGLADLSRVVFFDDMPENIAAARARGWRGEVIDHAGDTAGQMRGALRGLGVGV